MKNCLTVLMVLVGCLFLAAFLEFAINENFGRGFPGGMSLSVGQWQDYDDKDLFGLDVVICPDQIIVDIPATPVFKQVIEKGHWSLHAFYCDSHVDSPSEVEVARETKDEDLVVDIGRYVPSHPGKVTLVMMMRGGQGQPSIYPVYTQGQTVTYPPPKGLIRVGMLECDLRSLPWHADEIDSQNSVVHVDTTTLSDGSQGRNYFPGYTTADGSNDNDEPPMVYKYHSDRNDAPKLLVTVYHGRVTEVNGGAEDTADIPYQLPTPAPQEEEAPAPAPTNRSWAEWLFDLVFTK